MRPPSVCSTDSNYSVIGRKKPLAVSAKLAALAGASAKEEPIYSTFKPQSVVTTDNEEEEEEEESLPTMPARESVEPAGEVHLNSPKEKGKGGRAPAGGKKSDFARVSEDMSELVQHLNSIQNDISELANAKRTSDV